MPLSRDPVEDEGQLVRYLLGLLPEEEADRLDEASIADDEVVARLRSVENDLVDAYVRGLLDPETRARFESFYLKSPRRREKVKFAERFLGAVDRLPAPGAAPAGRAHSKFAWLVAIAALLFLACGLLLLQDLRLGRVLDQAQRDGAAIGGRAQGLARQLADARTANDDIAKELARVRSARPTAMTALVLLPQTRAIGPVSTIAVPSGADLVAFDLRLEANDFARYQAALRDPATNQIVWRSGVLTPGASPGPPTISVSVPARVLKPRHYSFELSGRPAAGAAEIIGSYAFQIESR